MSEPAIDRDLVLQHLDRVLSSDVFRDAERSSTMLRYIVERTLDGDGGRLKEYTVGAEALGRGTSFDPRTDPIVRAEASRLRNRLARYYAGDGRADAVVVDLPKGTYAPRFQHRAVATEISPAITADPIQGRPPNEQRHRRRDIAWLVIGSLTTVGAFAVGAWIARPTAPPLSRQSVLLDVQLQSNGMIGSEVGTDFVLAPDGSRIVFVSTDSVGGTRLRMRRFDGSPPVDLVGTNGARGPFLSPDGNWVGFWSGNQIKKTSLDGGSPVVLCDAADLLGATWGSDGTIVAVLDASRKLWRLPSTGGKPTAIVDLTSDARAPRWPQLLRDGKHVLYTAVGDGGDGATIEVLSIADGRRTEVLKGGTFGRYVAPGYLVYVNQGTLYAIRFDVDRLATRGSAIPIVKDVAYASSFGFAQVDVSAGGWLAYRRGGPVVVAWLDSTGHSTPLIDAPGRYAWPTLSPDGRRLAVAATESGVSRIIIFENLNGRPARVAVGPVGQRSAAWTPDGRFLIMGGTTGMTWMPSTGGSARSLLDMKAIAVPWTLTPDGSRLAFHAMGLTTALDLWTVPLTESDTGLVAGKPEPFLLTTAYEAYPTFSPDGRWLAYSSNESGTWEVYVRAVPDNGSKVRVSRRGGRVPRWSGARHELFFGTDDQTVMIAGYSISGGTFVPSIPRRWTTRRLADTNVLANFDVAKDGRHIIALLPAANGDDAPSENHVTLLSNFADELRRRLP